MSKAPPAVYICYAMPWLCSAPHSHYIPGCLLWCTAGPSPDSGGAPSPPAHVCVCVCVSILVHFSRRHLPAPAHALLLVPWHAPLPRAALAHMPGGCAPHRWLQSAPDLLASVGPLPSAILAAVMLRVLAPPPIGAFCGPQLGCCAVAPCNTDKMVALQNGCIGCTVAPCNTDKMVALQRDTLHQAGLPSQPHACAHKSGCTPHAHAGAQPAPSHHVRGQGWRAL